MRGNILNKIIEDNDLKSDAEVVKSLIDERSSGFKDPEQYRNWIYGNEEQLKNIESLALEEQVTELLISQSKSEDDLNFENILIDKTSADLLKGSEIDYVSELIGEQFKITNPQTKSSCGCGVSFSL